ncbi:MAG: acetyl-CoA carboxylase biotin carboxylase subunit [Culicoidibacterales bacterium]
MIKKVLIANRGEIAVRIIRACHQLGIQTVAVYSTVDKEALHVQLADQAVCIGEAAATKSYLVKEQILSAAVATGADAIHPGFGFLSENSQFAKMCQECGIIFIGPRAETIDSMGDKANAKATMIRAQVPVVPGSDGVVNDADEALKQAQVIGYPVLIKAVSGGGGKGMRLAYNDAEFTAGFAAARQEARAAFNDSRVYLEKFIENPRHIEVQIIADQYGNVVHLGERDCSVQRNNQKLIEEAPSQFIDDNLRAGLGQAAVNAAKEVGYINAGTIEFLVDKHKNYYFMEMNTRIQVEHPVTEMITGIDLVQAQIRIANGEPLGFTQEDVHFNGHAIECRINAEAPEQNFMPSPGLIQGLHFPGGNGVRIDSGVYAGYKILPYYDSMIAKIIVQAPTRMEAIAKMQVALNELIVDGVQTTADFQYQLLSHEKFQNNTHDTSFVAKLLEE